MLRRPSSSLLLRWRRFATVVLFILFVQQHCWLSISASEDDNEQQQKECVASNNQEDESSCEAAADAATTTADDATADDSKDDETSIPPYNTLELPHDWEEADDWGFYETWDHLDCNKIVLAAGRLIPTQDEWNVLRNVYRNVVGMDQSSILPTNEKNGWYIPYEVRLSPGAGRGVFATAPIAKGTRVWTSRNHQQARFNNATMYRQYLKSIPADLVCDVLQWTYIQDWGTETTDDDGEHIPKYYIFAELDEGALCNTGEDDEPNNVGCLPEYEELYDGGCRQNLFALRDIKEGEEILVSYGNWGILFHSWDLVGL